MELVKRVEIITEVGAMKEVRSVLDDLDITGFSMIRNVTGRGERGIQSGDELTGGAFSNALLITTCPPELVAALVDGIRPILQRRGGICLLTDTLSVKH